MIKLKSILVILLSSALIAGVILLTILGLSLRLGWKEKESARIHKDEIAKLNARLYGQYIKLLDMDAKYETKNFYKDKCVLEGVIENDGYRTITSLEMAIDFLNTSGEIIHTEIIHPLKISVPATITTIASLSLFTSGRETPMVPKTTVRFINVMDEQKEKDIVSPIKDRRYATNPNEWSGELKYNITHIGF